MSVVRDADEVAVLALRRDPRPLEIQAGTLDCLTRIFKRAMDFHDVHPLPVPARLLDYRNPSGKAVAMRTVRLPALRSTTLRRCAYSRHFGASATDQRVHFWFPSHSDQATMKTLIWGDQT